MEKKHENTLGNSCSLLPIMHGTHSCSARFKYLTIKKPYVRIFKVPIILGFGFPTILMTYTIFILFDIFTLTYQYLSALIKEYRIGPIIRQGAIKRRTWINA